MSRFCSNGYLRGLQLAFEDLILRPEIADAVLGHICDFHWEHHQRIFEAGRGRIDTTWVAEDLGAQTGPLMSLEMYRRFLLPNQIKMAELARSFGIHVMVPHGRRGAAVFARSGGSGGDRGSEPDPVAMSGNGAGAARGRFW